MTKILLKAEKRKTLGRKIKNLRREGILPANVFGKDVKSLTLQVNSKEFREVFKKAGETGIIDLDIAGESRPVLVSNLQIHPASGEVLHVDFRQVNLKEKVSAKIPVLLVGESPAEKSGIGTVVLLLQEIEVEALPAELPEKIEVDATALSEVDQVVKVSDLKLGKDVEIKTDAEAIIAKVEPPQKEEVVEVVAPDEGEATEEEKPVEGETKTEEKENPKAEETSKA